jgi:hypothetical protein
MDGAGLYGNTIHNKAVGHVYNFISKFDGWQQRHLLSVYRCRLIVRPWLRQEAFCFPSAPALTPLARRSRATPLRSVV